MKQPQFWPSFIPRVSTFIAVGAVCCNKATSKPVAAEHAAFESWAAQGQWCCATYSQTAGQWRALVPFGAANEGWSSTSLAGDVESYLLAEVCHGQCQRCYRPPPHNWFQLAYAWALERCLSPQYWLLVFNGLPFVEEVILYHKPLQKVYSVVRVPHKWQWQGGKQWLFLGHPRRAASQKRGRAEEMSFLRMSHCAVCCHVSLRLMWSYFILWKK